MSNFRKYMNPRRALRLLALKALERFGPGDVTIKHHYTKMPLALHSFRHKGYWYHGRRREQETMRFFSQVIHPGDKVIEVGGHIGYMSMYFSELVGPDGKVTVFEPGSNNLPYITKNTSQLGNVEVVPKAISTEDGIASFFEEQLTGQNNTLLSEYHVFEENCERAFTDCSYSAREVETLRLDSFVSERDWEVDFIKIDVEGAELLALQGAKATLASSLPVLTVEVTDHQEAVFSALQTLGYCLFTDTGRSLVSARDDFLNVCAMHPEKHAQLLAKLGWSRSLAA